MSKLPPTQIASVEISEKPKFNQWLAASIDGRYIYPQNGDVIDRTQMKRVASLKEKPGAYEVHDNLVEIHYEGNKIVMVGKQFGIGRPGTKPVGLIRSRMEGADKKGLESAESQGYLVNGREIPAAASGTNPVLPMQMPVPDPER